MTHHAPTSWIRAVAIFLMTSALVASAAVPARSANLRIKIVTVFSQDPNDPSSNAVGAIKVVIGGVTATTGDGTDDTKCLSGKNFRLSCSGA